MGTGAGSPPGLLTSRLLARARAVSLHLWIRRWAAPAVLSRSWSSRRWTPIGSQRLMPATIWTFGSNISTSSVPNYGWGPAAQKQPMTAIERVLSRHEFLHGLAGALLSA